MKTSIKTKLEQLKDRQLELEHLLADPQVVSNQQQFKEFSKEYSQLEPVVNKYKNYTETEEGLLEAQEMQRDNDPEIQQLAKEEIENRQQVIQQLENDIQVLLLPKDPNDTANIFLEIRAGTGGNEAAIFAGDLFRMYGKYAERNRWQVEIISKNEGEHGGYKEIIARIVGNSVYSNLKFESGTHRVQRVPETESQGRIHTSACTVAILPEQDEIDDIEIDPTDIRMDTFRSSGAGGQHVNTTDSAIRLTHIPSGIVVECQDERSQHKNRARAMSLLQAKLMDVAVSKQAQEQAASRKLQVGSGDRSQRIRTYNYPQGRITDHRINLTLYKLQEIIEGDLNQVIQPLTQEHQADLLAELGDN